MQQLKRALRAPEAKIRRGSHILALAAHDALLCCSWPCWLSPRGEMLHRGMTTRAQQCPPDPRGTALQVAVKSAKLAFGGTPLVEKPRYCLWAGAGCLNVFAKRVKNKQKAIDP